MKAILFLALIMTPALADKPAEKPKPPEPLTIKIIDGKLGDVGTATLKPDPKGGVAIALDLHGLPPGDHAIHIHETAKCQVAPGEAAFTTAGKNFNVDAKGKAKVTVSATNVTMEDGPHSVFTNGGTALVIHAKHDDMKTDP